VEMCMAVSPNRRPNVGANQNTRPISAASAKQTTE
jgi:hypothetical protein